MPSGGLHSGVTVFSSYSYDAFDGLQADGGWDVHWGHVAWEWGEGVDNFRCGEVCGEGLLGGREITEKDNSSADSDSRLPFAAPLVPNDAEEAGDVVAAFAQILVVFGVGRFAEIIEFIACLDAFGMINLMLGPSAMCEREDHTMRLQHPFLAGEGQLNWK